MLNDRIVLDEQLSNAVIGFLKASHVNDVVQIDSSNDLSARLASVLSIRWVYIFHSFALAFVCRAVRA